MTATSHSLIGASLATIFPNPVIAVPIAFASNFLLDMVPHWDVGTGWHNRPILLTFIYAGIDVIIGFTLSLLLFFQKVNPTYLISMIFVATIADWAESPYIFLGWNFPPISWFYKFQSKIHNRNKSIWGIITQVGIVIPIVLFAYFLK